MKVKTFLGLWALKTGVKVISIFAIIIHFLAFFALIVDDFYDSKYSNGDFHKYADLNITSAILMTINMCLLISYYLLFKSPKTRNYRLVLPALILFGILISYLIFYDLLTLLDINVEGMPLESLVAILVTIPMVYFFACLYSFFMELYSENTLAKECMMGKGRFKLKLYNDEDFAFIC